MTGYINRAKLEKDLDSVLYDLCKQYGAADLFTCGYRAAVCAVEASPAADVEEVRHGKWIPVSTYDPREYLYRCSACNRYESVMHEYCHCGAKMDGKGEVNE